jgi:hypothetical protein
VIAAIGLAIMLLRTPGERDEVAIAPAPAPAPAPELVPASAGPAIGTVSASSANGSESPIRRRYVLPIRSVSPSELDRAA